MSLVLGFPSPKRRQLFFVRRAVLNERVELAARALSAGPEKGTSVHFVVDAMLDPEVLQVALRTFFGRLLPT
jgi:hypothetical protein